jgi:hypothetical protein
MTATPSIDLPAWMAEQLSQASPDLTTRNLKRSLRNAGAGARLIQVDGLDKNLAAEVARPLQLPLRELHRLQRSLDRCVRRDQVLGCVRRDQVLGEGPSS